MADVGLLICLLCNETRYRSNRLLEPEEKLEPGIFDPASEDVPPANSAGPPQCHACGSPLQFIFESVLANRPGIRPKAPVTVAPPFTVGLPVAHPLVETLFAVGDGETITNTGASTDGYTMILTNKRLVRVKI